MTLSANRLMCCRLKQQVAEEVAGDADAQGVVVSPVAIGVIVATVTLLTLLLRR